MSNAVCVTVDVEDFYDGMAVLGHDVARPTSRHGGLEMLLKRLEGVTARPKVTLFVVGNYAPAVRGELAAFAAAGHEIASHGPDHGRPPPGAVSEWLRKGREVLEDLLGVSVRGFRSPRFDIPGEGLPRYRHQLAEAGYHYVSDTSQLGTASPVREVPVLSWRGVRVGGGSYQRLLPYAVVAEAARRAPGPAVLYYHSYDFDGTLPGLGAVRSPMLARQLLGRGRIAPMVWRLAERFGSETCAHVAI
ncbi:MAG TPA: DUF3473 domain-containing protein [Acidimicrobiales bacterium]|nr:DUF3473 domain-containing protein [Acidimicrobiales bacterium]